MQLSVRQSDVARGNYETGVFGVDVHGLPGNRNIAGGLFGKEQLLAVVRTEVQDHLIIQQEIRDVAVNDVSQIGTHLDVVASRLPSTRRVFVQFVELDIASDFHAAMCLSKFWNRDVGTVGELPTVDHDTLAAWGKQTSLETRDVQVFVGVIVAVVEIRRRIKTDLAALACIIRDTHIVETNVLGVAKLDAGFAVPHCDTVDFAGWQVERIEVQVAVPAAKLFMLRLRHFTIAVLVNLKALS